MDDREARLDRYSFSRASNYLRCPRAYYYRYGRKLLPIYNSPYLTRGTLVHAGLEAATTAQFNGERGAAVESAAIARIFDENAEYKKDPFIAGLIEADPEFEDGIDEVGTLAENVCIRVIRTFDLGGDRWETITLNFKPLIEYDFEVEVQGVKIHCKVDWIVRDTETGLIYEADFKTRKSFTSQEDDEMNAQHPMYMYALRQHGIHVDGSMTWQIKASEPKVPKLNKPTKNKPVAMSRSAISSNWETYKEALVAADLDPAEYEEMEGKLSQFEQLDQMLRTETECKTIWDEYTDLLRLMHGEPESLIKTRVLNPRVCKGCEYRDLCMEEARGKDIPENEYRLFGVTTQEQRLAASDD